MAEEVGRVDGRDAAEVFANGGVSAVGDEESGHFEVTVLGGEVEGGDALAMGEAAEGGLLVDGGTVGEEPRGGFEAVADGGPDERGSAVGIGIDAGAGGEEAREGLDAVGLAGPDEGFVEHFLRVGRGPPFGEAGVGAVEVAGGDGGGDEGAGGGETGVDAGEIAEAGGGSQVGRGDLAGGEEIGDFAVAPEEGDDERGTAGGVGFGVEGGAVVEQEGGQGGTVGVGGGVEGRPAVVVGGIGGGTGGEEGFDGGLVADVDGEIEESIAVGAGAGRESGVGEEEFFEIRRGGGFEGAEGKEEGFAFGICGNAGGVKEEGVPGVAAVFAGEGEALGGFREGRVIGSVAGVEAAENAFAEPLGICVVETGRVFDGITSFSAGAGFRRV